MIYCSNCGKAIPDNSKFCTFCGTAVPAIITDSNHRSQAIKSRPYVFSDHRGDFIRAAGFWGSLLVLAGFFLPWILQATNISGLNILTSGHKWGRLVLLIFPLCAFFILTDSLTNFLPSGAANFFKILPFLLLAILITLIVIGFKKTGANNLGLDLTSFKTAIKFIGIGLWLTALGSVIMLFHKKYERV